ncbi:hypothetical protein [Streptomyces deccanensis]|uniref:hypothetical protein n=1 Tax=Streptomyces deccanensis TaxID=424188 RepID=UPI001EFB1C50|nr:hypothetical protein [Streptomyces deccanensis]ULR47907.1 hypothetical protein L3078_00650 [Streptomyces deccanensis]
MTDRAGSPHHSTQRLRHDGRTLQPSRVLADRRLADEPLEQGIRNAFTLLGIEHEHARAVT